MKLLTTDPSVPISTVFMVPSSMVAGLERPGSVNAVFRSYTPIVSEGIGQTIDKVALLMCKNSHQTGQPCGFFVQKITFGDGVGPGADIPRCGAERPDAGCRQEPGPQPRYRRAPVDRAGRRTSN